MDVREDHQLFCLLRTHAKKHFLTLSTLDWLKARLGVCSVYETNSKTLTNLDMVAVPFFRGMKFVLF